MGAMDKFTSMFGFGQGAGLGDTMIQMISWILGFTVIGLIGIWLFFKLSSKYKAIIFEDKINGWLETFDRVSVKKDRQTGQQRWRLLKNKEVIPQCPDDLIYPTKGGLMTKGVVHIYKDGEGNFSYCTLNKFREMVVDTNGNLLSQNEKNEFVNGNGEKVENPILIKQPIIEPESRDWRQLMADQIVITSQKYSEHRLLYTIGIPVIVIGVVTVCMLLLKKGILG